MTVTFNSVTLPLARSDPGPLPSRDKVVEFPGSDGVEVLAMGKGAREIVVRCVSTADSPSRSTLEGLMDDDTHTLSVDGDSYANCRCVSVKPGARVNTVPDGYRQEYLITFRQEAPD